jgi:SAM-dependent methyltransferase
VNINLFDMDKIFSPEYLYSADERPAIRKIKEKSYMLMELQNGMKALDIGCGTGMDVIRMSSITGTEGRVFGVDADKNMVSVSQEGAVKAGVQDHVTILRAHSDQLELEDNYFNACRCERLLQHLTRIAARKTVMEAARVVKHGGRIVFIDTDWASLSFHAGDHLAERRIASICSGAIQNGFAARGLPELFSIAGIGDIQWKVNVLQLSLQEFDALVSPIVRAYIPYGYIDARVWENMHEHLQQLDRKNVFFCSLNMVTCYGRKS